jgi:hypothetical protein
MTMTHQSDKRDGDRYNLEAPVTWSYFNTNNHFRAKLHNYGNGGLYFESDSPPPLGTGIYIRIEGGWPRYSKREVYEGLRTTALGEVRWCQEKSGKEKIKYGIGVKFYPPVY